MIGSPSTLQRAASQVIPPLYDLLSSYNLCYRTVHLHGHIYVYNIFLPDSYRFSEPMTKTRTEHSRSAPLWRRYFFPYSFDVFLWIVEYTFMFLFISFVSCLTGRGNKVMPLGLEQAVQHTRSASGRCLLSDSCFDFSFKWMRSLNQRTLN